MSYTDFYSFNMEESHTFLSVMHDFTGKQRLESEDPRWGTIFRSSCVLTLRGDELFWIEYCKRLTENNILTGNLIILLQKGTNKIKQVLSRNGKPSHIAFEQTCITLHLISLIVHHYSSSLNENEVIYFEMKLLCS